MRGRRLYAALCFISVLGGTNSQAQSTDALILRFARGAVEPPPGRSSGSIDEFSFQDASLRASLVREGVTALAKLFPSFYPEHVNSRNLIDEPILLEDLSGFYLASLSSSDVAGAEARLRAIRGVLSANRPEPRYLLSACPPSNVDTYYSKQWWLHNWGDSTLCTPNPSYPYPRLVTDADINAPEAWCIATGDSSVRVAIIDTGIWASHEDLNVNLSGGKSFTPVTPIPPPPACYTACPPPGSCIVTCDSTITGGQLTCGYITPDLPEDDNSHGTAVAGIVAALGNNGKGVAGVSWNTKLIPIRIFDCETFSLACFSARALDTCRTRGIPIVNMSYGDIYPDAAERSAARNSLYAGQLLVAGNGNKDTTQQLFPAGYGKSVCAVGAFFGNGRRWDEGPYTLERGSNYGPWIDLAAPGGNLIVTTHWGCRLVNNRYYNLIGLTGPCGVPGDPVSDFGGTSAAAPVVSGVASLIAGKYRAQGLTGPEALLGEDLYQVMIRTARHPDPGGQWTQVRAFEDSTTAFFDDSAGYGHVRADTALRLLALPREVYHQRAVALAVVDSFQTLRRLKNFPGLPNSDSLYTVKCYVLRTGMAFNPAFTAKPLAWVRSSGTLGVKNVDPYDYNEEVYWGRIVSLTATSYKVETNVFRIIGVAPPYDWFPVVVANAAVAMTTVGVPSGGGGGRASARPAQGDEGDLGRPLPHVYALHANRPNPFEQTTQIHFDLPVQGPVRLEVFDAQGRLVRTLADGQFPPGSHAVEWDKRDSWGREVRPGVYLYRMRAGSFRDQQKMVLVRK